MGVCWPTKLVLHARPRIGLFIDHDNFQRPYQGIDGPTPSARPDRASRADPATPVLAGGPCRG
jgi:hypothetical protein